MTCDNPNKSRCTQGIRKDGIVKSVKARGLIVVNGGAAYDYMPPHVDVRIIDVDNIKAGDEKVKLPVGVGYEHLVNQAGIREYVDFVCPQCGALAGAAPCESTKEVNSLGIERDLLKRQVTVLIQRFTKMSKDQSVCFGCPARNSGCGWKCALTMADWSLTEAKKETS